MQHSKGLNGIPRISKHLGDVILHGTQHAKSRLMTFEKKKKIQQQLESQYTSIEFWTKYAAQHMMTHMFWNALWTTCSWQEVQCMKDTEELNSGNMCCPGSGGLLQYDGLGSISS